MVSLDSWIHTPPKQQIQFINDSFVRYEHFPNKMVLYHAAMFPSKVDLGRDETDVVKEINKIWRPLFDHFKVSVAFENHFHLYKITHPIYNGQIANDSAKGTIYIGDGAWYVYYTHIFI